MEPLNAAEQIIDPILTLFDKVVEYICAVTGNKQDRERLRLEIRDCELALLKLKDESNSEAEEKWLETIQALNELKAALDKLRLSLDVTKKQLSPKNESTGLQWPFQSKEIEDIVGALARQKPVLQMALTNPTQKPIQKCTKQPEEENTNHQLPSPQETPQHQNLPTKITPIITPQHQQYITHHIQGTNRTFLSSPSYKTWHQTPSQILFCPGLPESGKTITTCAIIQDLMDRYNATPGIGIAYTYCDVTQTASNILQSLLNQLMHQNTQFVEEGLKTTNNPSSQLQTLIPTNTRTFIIIDALDTIPPPSRSKLLTTLSALSTTTNTNIMITHRPHISLSTHFNSSTTTCLEIKTTRSDIALYIQSQLHRLPDFVNGDKEWEEEITDRVLHAFTGRYRYR